MFAKVNANGAPPVAAIVKLAVREPLVPVENTPPAPAELPLENVKLPPDKLSVDVVAGVVLARWPAPLRETVVPPGAAFNVMVPFSV